MDAKSPQELVGSKKCFQCDHCGWVRVGLVGEGGQGKCPLCQKQVQGESKMVKHVKRDHGMVENFLPTHLSRSRSKKEKRKRKCRRDNTKSSLSSLAKPDESMDTQASAEWRLTRKRICLTKVATSQGLIPRLKISRRRHHEDPPLTPQSSGLLPSPSGFSSDQDQGPLTAGPPDHLFSPEAQAQHQIQSNMAEDHWLGLNSQGPEDGPQDPGHSSPGLQDQQLKILLGEVIGPGDQLKYFGPSSPGPQDQPKVLGPHSPRPQNKPENLDFSSPRPQDQLQDHIPSSPGPQDQLQSLDSSSTGPKNQLKCIDPFLPGPEDQIIKLDPSSRGPQDQLIVPEASLIGQEDRLQEEGSYFQELLDTISSESEDDKLTESSSRTDSDDPKEPNAEFAQTLAMQKLNVAQEKMSMKVSSHNSPSDNSSSVSLTASPLQLVTSHQHQMDIRSIFDSSDEEE